MNNTIINAKSGHDRILLIGQSQDIDGTTIQKFSISGNSWSNTADELTSLLLYPDTDSFGIGSQISLYRRISS